MYCACHCSKVRVKLSERLAYQLLTADNDYTSEIQIVPLASVAQIWLAYNHLSQV